ncbi:S-adenosyl-L-methionine-dependent methyltransferase [Microthyrium microscopicum]|uniref:DNA (cytosine-5-)-methyltransferase n=1 Tax=Microthyrium microscopicum TaxID=703497 RepID=A0A6A6UEC5_9PEZI|nr:S-adenosyl-L-methionine-dependent methyltransferase [Microthyrium microscopicum]
MSDLGSDSDSDADIELPALPSELTDDPELLAAATADLTKHKYKPRPRTSFKARQLPNPATSLTEQDPALGAYFVIDRTTLNQKEIRSGCIYHMHMHLEGDAYFRVLRLLESADAHSRILAQGHIFLATKAFDGLFPIVKKEVVLLADTLYGLKEPARTQAIETIPITELGEEVSIRFFQADDTPANAPGLGLFCRRIFFRLWRSLKYYVGTRTIAWGGVIRSLNPKEVFELSGILHGPIQRVRLKAPHDGSHTFADVCHGTGGATEAAKLAGLQPSFAIDIDKIRSATYRRNNEDIMDEDDIICEDVFNLNTVYLGQRIDVLHCSFPCKVWSWRKIWPTKMDERNRAIVFEWYKVLNLIRPRQATMEQVDGMVLSRKHTLSFFRLIRDTLANTSMKVAWYVHELCDHGLPSRRRRLLLTASRPDEYIPAFAPATHGPRAKRPWFLPRDALRNIPEGIPHHDITDEVRRPIPNSKPIPWDTLSPTVVCSGSNIHPDGTRRLTIREWLRLQRFPDTFELVGTYAEAVRQIGDAVPPIPFSQVLNLVRKALQSRDGPEGTVPCRSIYDEDILPVKEADYPSVFRHPAYCA